MSLGLRYYLRCTLSRNWSMPTYRNLGSFVTDVENSFRLAELLPENAVKVSESGISNPDTVRALRQAGFRGFLIGENFMKTPDPGQALNEFISQL